MNIIAVVSAMGGVGKTTFSANLSIAMARLGVPTLAIDLAPQDALQLHFSASEPADQGLVQAALPMLASCYLMAGCRKRAVRRLNNGSGSSRNCCGTAFNS